MKRQTIAPEHKKFFQLHGYISFDQLVLPHEMQTLWKRILERRTELKGPTHDNISRSVPSVLTLARKLGGIAAALLDRKPIRCAYDGFVEDLNEIQDIEEREVGLLLAESGKGLFFTQRSHLYNEKEPCYLLLVFTANYVNNPILFQ